MSKLKLTKNELKKQKDDLKRFFRYLPTLQLKKQQLQMEIMKIAQNLHQAKKDFEAEQGEVDVWVDLFAENQNLQELVKVESIETEIGNIAGVDVPYLKGIDFLEQEYSLLTTPLWVDYGIEAIKKMVNLKVKRQIIQAQLAAIREELRITTQRVNLFEKVKIPDTKENIRVIQIYLGDLQTADVVRGKLAKAKIEKRKEAAMEV